MNLVNEDMQDYIKINSYSTSSKDFMCKMVSSMQALEMLEIQLTDEIKKINEIIQCAINFNPPRFIMKKYDPKVCFMVNKFLNIFMKYQGLRFSRCQQAIQATDKFKSIIAHYISQNVDAEIEFWNYITFIFSKTDKHLHKLVFKLKSMYYYIRNLQIIERHPIYSDIEMLQEIKELIPEVDSSSGFIHQNKFDLMLESYIESNNELHSIFERIMKISPKQNEFKNDSINKTKIIKNETVNNRSISHLILNDFDFFIETVEQKVSQIKNVKKSIFQFKYSNNENDNNNNRNKQSKLDFKLFDKLVDSIYTKIVGQDSHNKKIFIIIRYAALRYLCNKYYLIHHKKWLQKPSQIYYDNIQKIVKETPRDLLISMDIIPHNFYDTSFDKLLLSDNFLKATDHIFSIQFYTCPIDIWMEIYISIVYSMAGANKFTNVSCIQSKIPFDDFFSILLPVFSSAQITCPNALNSLLSCFLMLKKQNSLEIASTTILALLKIIETKM